MKMLLKNTAWGILITALLYTVVRPDYGILYQNTLNPLGLGLIGLGLCLHARKRAMPAVAKVR